ncbi:MAG: glycosyltransferase family 4 protein [Ruminococcaceae bacterium]|nr:glycosyltransferase family 4 protein [Oscillospiraceae bacterium]
MKKKVLIISANPVDLCQNNGKTLLSFFDGYDTDRIAQLYFYPTVPNTDAVQNFFRISDLDVLRKRLGRVPAAGGTVKPAAAAAVEEDEDTARMGRVKKGALMRLAREVLWKGAWKSRALDAWLDDFAPECIFFVAGDGLYTYDIFEYAKRRSGAKSIVYVTDDYILPRRTWNPVRVLRQRLTLRRMKRCVREADAFLTISEKMRRTYRDVLGKDSMLAVNMSDCLKEDDAAAAPGGGLLLTYLGGLHYNRDKTLRRLGEAVAAVNASAGTELFLEIYSNARLDDAQRAALEVPGASRFCGQVDRSGVRRKVNEADVLVHVESFLAKNVEDVLLSVSTKIPEYLSVGKPILAIGPANVASMEYLQEIACCVTDEAALEARLRLLAETPALRSELGRRAEEAYWTNHSCDVQRDRLWQLIDQL